jgi:hypothetical protein
LGITLSLFLTGHNKFSSQIVLDRNTLVHLKVCTHGCVVDPLGVWWGMRLAADGLSPARHPVVVLGGRHADIPLTVGMGAALGRLIGAQGLACVVDVSDLDSAAARRSFMTAFT